MKKEFAFLLFCWFATAVMLISSCTKEAEIDPETVEEAAEAMEEHGALAEAGFDPLPVIAQAGEPWAGEPLMDRFSAGTARRSVFYSMGGAVFDRGAGGKLTRITLNSGSGDRCGDPAPLMAAYDALQEAAPFGKLDGSDRTRLEQAIGEDGWEEAETGGVLVRGIGGCVKVLVIKAI